MSDGQVSIPTRNGDRRAYVCTPPAAGRYRAVILFMDGLAPTIFEMGQRLADHG